MADISVIIPCYNEEAILPELHRRLVILQDEHVNENFEFVLVNDGSQDRTRELLNEIAQFNSSFKVIHLAKNCGHQIAVAAGMDYATGDAVVVLDADLQDPPELIPNIVDKIREGYDVVHMQRDERRGESWFKLFCASWFYKLFKCISDIDVVENCGDFRGISKRALAAALSCREPHKFHRAMFSHIGFRQCVMSYQRDARFAGETKYPFIKSFKLALNAIMSFTAAPLSFVFSAAFVLWAVSLTYGAWALYGRVVLNNRITGLTSLIVMTVFLVGVILFSLAIIGCYIRRIFEQGQHRPLYWISETCNLELSRYSDYREQRIAWDTCNEAAPEFETANRVPEFASAES